MKGFESVAVAAQNLVAFCARKNLFVERNIGKSSPFCTSSPVHMVNVENAVVGDPTMGAGIAQVGHGPLAKVGAGLLTPLVSSGVVAVPVLVFPLVKTGLTFSVCGGNFFRIPFSPISGVRSDTIVATWNAPVLVPRVFSELADWLFRSALRAFSQDDFSHKVQDNVRYSESEMVRFGSGTRKAYEE